MTATVKRIQWPTAAVLMVQLAGTVAILVLVQHDRAMAVAAWTAACAVVQSQMPRLVGGGS